MKTMIQFEEAAMLVMSYLLTLWFEYTWWLFLALLLTPDISMLGYVFGNKAGAYVYNLFHLKSVAVLVTIIGYLISNQVILFSGILLFGHSSMDRIFGYGLKYTDDFKNTHLGWLGQDIKN